MLGLKANCDYSAVESWALNITAAISGERCMKGRLNVWHVEGFFFFFLSLRLSTECRGFVSMHLGASDCRRGYWDRAMI